MAFILIVEDEDQVRVLAEEYFRTSATLRFPPVFSIKRSHCLKVPNEFISCSLTSAFSRIFKPD